jgi:hypothetical protein
MWISERRIILYSKNSSNIHATLDKVGTLSPIHQAPIPSADSAVAITSVASYAQMQQLFQPFSIYQLTFHFANTLVPPIHRAPHEVQLHALPDLLSGPPSGLLPSPICPTQSLESYYPDQTRNLGTSIEP